MTKEEKKCVVSAIRKQKRLARRRGFYQFYVQTDVNTISHEEYAARYLSIKGWDVLLLYSDMPGSRICSGTIRKK